MVSYRSYNDHPPDGGYGWVVVCSGHLCLVISAGVVSALGVYLPSIMDTFEDASGAVVGLIISVCVGLAFGSGPLSCQLMIYYGGRRVVMLGGVISMCGLIVMSFTSSIVGLTIGMGILLGIGFGLTLAPSLAINSFYFTTKYILANSIASAGIGIGCFVFPPLTEWLIEKYGWRGAALIESAICLHSTFFGALFQPLKKKHSVTSLNDGHESVNDYDLDMSSDDATELTALQGAKPSWRQKLNKRLRHTKQKLSLSMETHVILFKEAPMVILLAFTAMIYMSSYFNFLVYFVKIAVDSGTTTKHAAAVLAVSGMASTVGRISSWPLVTITHNPQLIFVGSNILLAIPLLAFHWLSSYPAFMVAGVFIGLAVGTTIPVANIVAKEIVSSKDRHALVIGWLYFFQGVGIIVAGYLGGILGERTANYSWVLLTGGVMSVIGSLLSLILYIKMRRTQN